MSSYSELNEATKTVLGYLNGYNRRYPNVIKGIQESCGEATPDNWFAPLKDFGQELKYLAYDLLERTGMEDDEICGILDAVDDQDLIAIFWNWEE